jgi:hypothetical protein
MSSHDAMDTLDCPNCQRSYNMLDSAPFSQSGDNGAYTPGGGTIAGISLKEQGDIGENLVRTLGEIPGYGPITWWHEGGASASSPLDGGTTDWGIEVKTLNADAKNQRWIPGGARRSKIPGSPYVYDEKDSKNRAAEEMGYKGVLGVLVILDYRRSIADIYVREMALEGEIRDTMGRPQPSQKPGVFAWRKHNGTHLVKEVPFANPFLQPKSAAPEVSDIPF